VIDPDTFRHTLGRFASGVTVVTVSGTAGDCGMTVSAFCSLSLTPPLVLICIDHSARMYEVIGTASHFAVNVLEASQEPLARRFADPEMDRFDGIHIRRGRFGAPLLDDVLATLECRRLDAHPGGDHTIYTGLVESATSREGQPLIYYRGAYRGLER
jgi:flavin reductase (DIM6/NTAB) family NADH-FMN oxidoreductase RutF